MGLYEEADEIIAEFEKEILIYNNSPADTTYEEEFDWDYKMFGMNMWIYTSGIFL